MGVHSLFLLFRGITLSVLLLLSVIAKAGWTGKPALQNKFSESEVLAACREGNIPAARFYLDQPGFDPNLLIPGGPDKIPTFGLFLAASNGRRELVEVLICRNNVNINQTRKDQCTALFIAVQQGHVDVVDVLLGAPGIDPNLPCEGEPPLNHAAVLGHVEIVKSLAGAPGIQLNAKGADGFTALRKAVASGFKDVVEVLIAAGAKIDQSTDAVSTYSYAVRNGHWSLAEYLEEQGADTSYNGHPFVKKIRVELPKNATDKDSFSLHPSILKRSLQLCSVKGSSEGISVVFQPSVFSCSKNE